MSGLIACLLGPLLHQPIRTLEQPLVYTAPLGVWSW